MNRGHMEQAITNLVDNAIKYSDAGSTIDIEVSTAKNEILISVMDRGIGIDNEHLPRLFERFYRVDQARSREAGGTEDHNGSSVLLRYNYLRELMG